MAAYATAEHVRSAVARDPERSAGGTAAALEDAPILLELQNAQAQVDAKLSGRYTVPFEPVPHLIWSITVDIAAYLATLTYFQGKHLEPRSPVALRYERAMKLLCDIADGDADLDVDDGGGTAASTVGTPINPNPNMFGLGDFGLAHDGWC